MTLTEKLDRIPPCIARLLAKSEGRLMTTSEIMKATGFSKWKVDRISNAKTWANISVKDVDLFLSACGLSWSAQRKQRWLLGLAVKKGRVDKMRHLKVANRIESAQVKSHIRRITKLFSE